MPEPQPKIPRVKFMYSKYVAPALGAGCVIGIGLYLTYTLTALIDTNFAYVTVPMYVASPLSPIGLALGLAGAAILNEDVVVFGLLSAAMFVFGATNAMVQCLKMTSVSASDWEKGTVYDAMNVTLLNGPLSETVFYYQLYQGTLIVWFIIAICVPPLMIHTCAATTILPESLYSRAIISKKWKRAFMGEDDFKTRQRHTLFCNECYMMCYRCLKKRKGEKPFGKEKAEKAVYAMAILITLVSIVYILIVSAEAFLNFG